MDIKEKQLTTYQRLLYKTFSTPEGKEFLEASLKSIVLEEPADLSLGQLAWLNGRHSIFRDIKNIISLIEVKHEQSRTNSRD